MKFVVLLLMTISVCSAELVREFTRDNCGQFFADPHKVVSPPTRFEGSQYKKICQRRNNTYEFATYYDTTNRIPVYSAYKFLGKKNGCSNKTWRTSWFIEPQLYRKNLYKNNRCGSNRCGSNICGSNRCGCYQALDSDYDGTGFDRGHLFPVSHTKTKDCSKATFTLTNAAPQNSSFNSGQWRLAEMKLADTLTDSCLNKGLSAYVVTGVVPGNKTLNNRVNVPKYFWSAYCCLDNNNRPKVSGGHYGENVNEPVQKVSEKELEGFLAKAYKVEQFKLFGEGCSERHRTTPRPRKRILDYPYIYDSGSFSLFCRSIVSPNKFSRIAERSAASFFLERSDIPKFCADFFSRSDYTSDQDDPTYGDW